VEFSGARREAGGESQLKLASAGGERSPACRRDRGGSACILWMRLGHSRCRLSIRRRRWSAAQPVRRPARFFHPIGRRTPLPRSRGKA